MTSQNAVVGGGLSPSLLKVGGLFSHLLPPLYFDVKLTSQTGSYVIL